MRVRAQVCVQAPTRVRARVRVRVRVRERVSLELGEEVDVALGRPGGAVRRLEGARRKGVLRLARQPAHLHTHPSDWCNDTVAPKRYGQVPFTCPAPAGTAAPKKGSEGT